MFNYTKKVFGSPRLGLLERAEDVGVESQKARCRLIAGLGVDKGMV
jgi:hypothetical protein